MLVWEVSPWKRCLRLGFPPRSANTSNTSNPTLCRVPSYFRPGLPKPTNNFTEHHRWECMSSTMKLFTQQRVAVIHRLTLLLWFRCLRRLQAFDWTRGMRQQRPRHLKLHGHLEGVQDVLF